MGTTGSRRNPKITRPCSVADDGNDVYFLLKHGSLAKKKKKMEQWKNHSTRKAQLGHQVYLCSPKVDPVGFG